MFKPALIASVVLVGGLSLTGCTASNVNDSASSSDGKSYSGFQEFENKTLIKDENGEYMSTQISPTSNALKYDVTRTSPDFYRLGFTDADGKSAQEWLAKFIGSEGIDSAGLDNATAASKWVDANFDTYVAGPYVDELRKDISATDSQYSFLIKSLPLTVRDGKPRVKSSTIHINEVTASKDEKGTYLEIAGTATTQYRASEKNILAYAVKANESQKLDEATITAVYPKLKDGKEEVIDSVFNFRYYLQKIDGKWKIVNYNNGNTWQIESMRADAVAGSEATPSK